MATAAFDGKRVGAEDRFFVASAFLMATIVVAGFSLHFAMGRSSFGAPPIVHLHAVIFMGWICIYVAQTLFAASGNMSLHRRLGWIAAFWSAAMVVLGIVATVLMVRRGAAPFFFQPAYFLVMNGLSVLTFGGLTAAAIVLRRHTLWHRRLHFCGMAVLLGPAVGRLLPMPFLPPYAGEAVFAVLMLFPLVGVVADYRQGRVHPAWLVGLAVMAVMQVAINVIAIGPAGIALFDVVTAGSPAAAMPPLDFPPPPATPLITGQPGAM